MLESLPQRIASKIFVGVGCGCWEWVGCVQSNGYGRAWNGNIVTYAHRVVFNIVNGPFDSSLDLDHLCRNRRCVNPSHLEPVTRSENLRRGMAGENIASIQRIKTHCPKGHEYNEENTSRRNGKRHCKKCAIQKYHSTKVLKNG